MTKEMKEEIKEHLEKENQSWGLGLVKTLEKENEQLKWEQKQILEDNDNYQKEIEELKKAVTEKNSVVEKMKNCQNCKYYDGCGLDNIQCSECYNGIEKWELAE